MLLHAQHREITDDLDFVQVARNFTEANDERKKYFGPADYFFIDIKNILFIMHSPL